MLVFVWVCMDTCILCGIQIFFTNFFMLLVKLAKALAVLDYSRLLKRILGTRQKKNNRLLLSVFHSPVNEVFESDLWC